MSYEQRLKSMGYVITPMPAEEYDNGHFVQAVRTGNVVFTAGQISSWEGRDIKGKVGDDLDLENGREAARLCALNCLRAIRTVVPSLDQVTRIVKIFGMVNIAPGFDHTTLVIHEASTLLRKAFGQAGLHARCAMGMTVPFNWAVEIEMVAEISP